MYRHCLKRVFDFVLSLISLVLLSWLFALLIILGTIFMRGNPFFTQERPGKNERIFKLIKFRTMDNRKNENGDLLPDAVRLNKYGRLLRSTSLDELPELINILKGDMAIIGPRPLLVRYLPYYTATERHRHDVRPGLSGLAQVNGRNLVKWDQRLAYDVEYVNKISFALDLSIVFQTLKKVFLKEDIAVDTDTVEAYLDVERADKAADL